MEMRCALTATSLASTFHSRETCMTDPTGRSFLSYRRTRKDEAALLVQAHHDHGIPTWQDVQNLGSVPTEDEIRRILADTSTASAILFITPEVEDSPIIRNVEVPNVIKRVERQDGFFAVPIAAGGLDYATAAQVTSNHLSAQNLSDWNMHRIASDSVSLSAATIVAEQVLVQRIQAIHALLPRGAPLKVGLFVRRAAPFELGNTLAIDWSGRFRSKETSLDVWQDVLLPALSTIARVIGTHAPGRNIEAFGLPTLPAAAALGCAFISTGGITLSWRQFTPGKSDQYWSLQEARSPAEVTCRTWSKAQDAQDIAVLVSLTDDVEPVFASCQGSLPTFRALVHIRSGTGFPHMIESAGQAHDIARKVEGGIRSARREYGGIGTVHLFMSVPAGLAVLIGQLLNTFGLVQTYEHVSVDGSGCYRPGPLLRPCT